MNTVCLNNGNVTGYNTDIDGFELSLQNWNTMLVIKRYDFGSRRSCAFNYICFKKMNAPQIYLSNRTKEKAQILKNYLME